MRKGWAETTLNDVAIASWGNTETTKSKYVSVGFTAYSASGADGYLEWFEHDCNAVVLSAIGAQCGKTWFAQGRWTSIKNTIWIKGTENQMLDKYLYYLSNREQFWQIRGQAQPFISLGDVRTTKFLLPPLQEQKRIVDLISSVDSYIDALQHQADSAKKSRSAVLHEMLSAGGDGWKTHKLGDLLQINRGGSPRPIQQFLTNSSDGVNWIKIADATASTKYIYETKQKILASGVERSRAVQSGDFILSNSMSYGRPYIMRTAGAIHDGWLLLSHVDKHFDEDFLFNLLLSDSVQKQFDALSAGSGVQNLNIEVVKKVVVRIPDIEVQRIISKVLNEYDSLELAMDNTINNSRRFRSGLLSDLLSGEHEIPASYDKIMGAA